MLFSTNDIDYIRRGLKNKGIGYAPLQEELIDHIMCEAEGEMAKGKSLKSAVDTILNSPHIQEFTTLQDTTIKADNYSPKLMIRNITKMLFRNLSKNKKYAIINLSGLAIGLACFITISLYVLHESNFDRGFSNYASIYRVTMSSTVGAQANHIPTSYPTLGPEMQNRFGDIEKYVRIINYKYSRLVPTVQVDEKIFYEENVIFADTTFFDLFNFEFLEGNPATALLQPNSIVITKQMAEKYFGDASALGQHVTFNTKTALEITGVLNDLPSQTHLQFDFVIPMSGFGNSGMFGSFKATESWQVDWFWTYFLIPNQQAVPKVEAGINSLAEEKIPDARKEHALKFYLQALKDVHLHSEFDYNTDLTQNGDIKNLYIFIGIGVLILIISSINFINLSIATATRRYKEIGVSKVLGALKTQLQFQFIVESIIVSLAALIIAYLFLQALLPLFNTLLAVKLSIDPWHDWRLILASIVFTIFIGIISGMYPAFFVSSFEPQKVLKGMWKPGRGGENFRKALIGIQIAISVFLVVGTIVIYSQLQFIQNKSLGYDKENIVMVPIRGTNLVKNYYSFKNNLLTESSIAGVTSVSEPIGREVQFMSFKVDNQPSDQFVKILNVTHDFVKTMGLEIQQGRDFSKDFSRDSTSGFVINEAAARAFGWDDPIGKPLDHSFRQSNEGHVIGVVKDFNFEPLQKKVDPIIMWFGGAYWYVAVRIQSNQAEQALKALEKEWLRFEPEKPFAFTFLDQAIQHVYEKEKRLSDVFLVFSFLSILTGMMGLYGLVSFAMDQRLQEIGIRKVLGASANSIFNLVTKEYLMLVVMSFILAAPVTYWIMSNWLEGFAFRIVLNSYYFVASLLVIASIVMLTIFSKVIYAARSNPTEVLRSE
jgi:putative ABC transport system permease protein